MHQTRFDSITRFFAGRRARRGSTRTTARLSPDSLGIAPAVRDIAQEATPAAEPTGALMTFLFVQSFRSGNLAPSEEDGERFTLTLEQGLGQTIYFSDRPGRVVGAAPTAAFLDGLGFDDENPPNAALIIERPDGAAEIAVVELYDPVFNPESPGVTYEVRALKQWVQDLELGFTEAPMDLGAIEPEFEAAHLFIDDCADRQIWCRNPVSGARRYVGDYGMCWYWNYFTCLPCEPYGHDAPSSDAINAWWANRCKEIDPGLCEPRCELELCCDSGAH